MRTLVTGGAGFIGIHLVKALTARGDDVIVLDSLEEQVHAGRAPVLPSGVEFIRGDVGDPAAADRALRRADRVVHLAAVVGVGQSMYDIARYTRANTMATATFLERLAALRRPPERLVVASSMSIYGEGRYSCETHGALAPPPRPESQLADHDWELECPSCRQALQPLPTDENKPVIPTSIYAINKRDQEEMGLVTGAAYGIPTTALRFFNVYGPGQALSNPYTGVAAIFASRLLNGRAPLIFEDGRQTRDFIHVSDIVRGILLALESASAAGEAINLGTGRPTSVRRIADVIAAGLGVDVPPVIVNRYRAGDIRHCFADPARAREILGFEARTTLDAGMAELTEWLAGQHAEDHVENAARELLSRGLAR